MFLPVGGFEVGFVDDGDPRRDTEVIGPLCVCNTSNFSNDPEVSASSIAGAAGIAESVELFSVVRDKSRLLVVVLIVLCRLRLITCQEVYQG